MFSLVFLDSIKRPAVFAMIHFTTRPRHIKTPRPRKRNNAKRFQRPKIFLLDVTFRFSNKLRLQNSTTKFDSLQSNKIATMTVWFLDLSTFFSVWASVPMALSPWLPALTSSACKRKWVQRLTALNGKQLEILSETYLTMARRLFFFWMWFSATWCTTACCSFEWSSAL